MDWSRSRPKMLFMVKLSSAASQAASLGHGGGGGGVVNVGVVAGWIH